jgi:hypothetical protein
MPALAISPYAKKGAVVSTRYDMLSFIRTMEIVIGMKPLGLMDSLAVPLYDAFDAQPQNAEPYNVVQPTLDIGERNGASAPAAALSRKMNLHELDRTPQRMLDGILWKSVHGEASQPPPPGPNASGKDD